MDPSIPTSRLRLDYQLYRQLGLLVGVSFPTRPYHGIVRDVSSWGYRSPHVLAKSIVSLHVLARFRVPCIVRQRYRSLVLLARVTPPARLFPLAGLVGTGFDLRVAGLPRTPFYIVCTFMVW